MTFQKVLRVPKGILRGTEDMRFLHKSDLEKLSEHDLFFFLRTSDYHILCDYPCMGAFERRLDFSKIEGPFENAPKIEQRGGRGYSESEKDILERLVPSNIMPVTFQAITYASYGIAVDENSQRHLGLVAEIIINPDEIWATGNTILANLQKRGTKIEQPNGSCYATTIENCLVEFNLAESNNFHPHQIDISIFGIGETPLELMKELGVYAVGRQFSSYDKDVGIVDTARRGLSYNLLLNGKSISDVLKSENIVI